MATVVQHLTGHFKVEVLSGQSLRDRSRIGKSQSPYVRMKVFNESGATIADGCTGAVVKGGKNPRWSLADRNVLTLPFAATSNRLTLWVEVMAERASGDEDKLIGSTMIELAPHIRRALTIDEDLSSEQMAHLTSRDGRKRCGSLSFGLHVHVVNEEDDHDIDDHAGPAASKAAYAGRPRTASSTSASSVGGAGGADGGDDGDATAARRRQRQQAMAAAGRSPSVRLLNTSNSLAGFSNPALKRRSLQRSSVGKGAAPHPPSTAPPSRSPSLSSPSPPPPRAPSSASPAAPPPPLPVSAPAGDSSDARPGPHRRLSLRGVPKPPPPPTPPPPGSPPTAPSSRGASPEPPALPRGPPPTTGPAPPPIGSSASSTEEWGYTNQCRESLSKAQVARASSTASPRSRRSVSLSSKARQNGAGSGSGAGAGGGAGAGASLGAYSSTRSRGASEAGTRRSSGLRRKRRQSTISRKLALSKAVTRPSAKAYTDGLGNNEGVLTVTAVSGHALRSREMFGKQDPYVKFTLLDSDANVMSEGRTATVVKGGREPKWDHDAGSIDMQYSAAPDRQLLLLVEAFDEDKHSKHDLIGRGEVSLSDITLGSTVPTPVPLKNSTKKKDCGTLFLAVAMSDTYMRELAATALQTQFRARRARRDYAQAKTGAVLLQASYRGRSARTEYERMRRAAVFFQAAYRRRVAYNEFHTQKSSAVKLQVRMGER